MNTFRLTEKSVRFFHVTEKRCDINVDLGKALAIIDSCLSRLQRLRNDPDEIIKTCENECHQAKWKKSFVRR